VVVIIFFKTKYYSQSPLLGPSPTPNPKVIIPPQQVVANGNNIKADFITANNWFIVKDQIVLSADAEKIQVGDLASGDGKRDLALYAGDQKVVHIDHTGQYVDVKYPLYIPGLAYNGIIKGYGSEHSYGTHKFRDVFGNVNKEGTKPWKGEEETFSDGYTSAAKKISKGIYQIDIEPGFLVKDDKFEDPIVSITPFYDSKDTATILPVIPMVEVTHTVKTTSDPVFGSVSSPTTIATVRIYNLKGELTDHAFSFIIRGPAYRLPN